MGKHQKTQLNEIRLSKTKHNTHETRDYQIKQAVTNMEMSKHGITKDDN